MKKFKTLKELHDEELYKYVYEPCQLSFAECTFADGEFISLKNHIVALVENKSGFDDIQTVFPFPYSPSVEGDYERRLELAKKKVNLDYAIKQNTAYVDFILKCLRGENDLEECALYLVKENQNLPDTTPFRVVKYFRTIELVPLLKKESNYLELLCDKDDCKELYAAYERLRENIVKSVTDWYEEYGSCAFEIVMYNWE